MKKLLSYLLVIALVLVQFVSVANAATITIENSVVNQTYSAYKIFDVTKSGKAHAYSIQTTNEWYSDVVEYASQENSGLKLTTSTDGVTVVVEVTTGTFDAAKFAKFLDTKKANKTADKTEEGTGETIQIKDLAPGYYFVDSTLGTLCILNTTDAEQTIAEKNGVPTVDKEVLEDSTNQWGASNSAELGQVVKYQTTVTVKSGAENYTLYDIMSEGITFNKDVKVYLNNKEVSTENYTLSYTDTNYTFVLSFNDEYIAKLENNTELVVTYTGTVNKNAVIEEEGNKNETFLKYGDENHLTTTPPDTTTTYVYEFELVKTNTSNEILEGAQFELYRNNETKPLEFVLVSEENNVFVYRLATSEDQNKTTTIKAGQTTIKGLDLDGYYIKVTVAPEGYNKLTTTVTVNVNEEAVRANIALTETGLYNQGGINVVNLTGLELPSTGGMGTVLFITVGSIMVLGFGVLLVTKLRISKMEI